MKRKFSDEIIGDNLYKLKKKYSNNDKFTTIIDQCQNFSEHFHIKEKHILNSGLPPYMIYRLLGMLHDKTNIKKILFYLNRGVPIGNSSFYATPGQEKIVEDGFRELHLGFPLFSDIPELANEIIAMMDMDLYSPAHLDIMRKLISINKSKGSQIRKSILDYSDISIRDNLMRQFILGLNQDDESRDKTFSAIQYALQLPTKKYTVKLNKELYQHTFATLNQEVYGMEKAKSVFMSNLEFMNHKSCIALIGPPGIGKTSLMYALGKALDRPVYKITMPGVEVLNLKGSPRVYVGAGPGKIADAFKTTQSTAPIILLDELDKVPQGKVMGLISDLLDETQHYFEDVYLDISICIQQVLFVVSMNDTAHIDNYLLDRMLLIHIDPPSANDKFTILKTMKIPPILTQLKIAKDVSFTKDAIEYIVSQGSSDSGIRRPLQLLEVVLKKIHMFITMGTNHDIVPKKIKAFKLPLEINADVVKLLQWE